MQRKKSITSIIYFVMQIIGCGGSHVPEAQQQDTQQEETAHTTPDQASDSAQRILSTDTEWLAILIDGKKSGYVKSTREFFADKIETKVTSHMEIGRGMETITMVSTTHMTETLDGMPLSFKKTSKGAGMNQVISGKITPDGRLRLTTESGGRISSRTVDWTAGALMNEGQRLEAKRYGLKEGLTYKSKYFDPDLLETLDVEVHVGEKKQLDLLGRIVTGTKMTLKMAIRGTPIDIVLYVDDDMNTLENTTHRMGMKIEMLACTEHYALSDNDPHEIVRATFVNSPISLSPKRLETPLTYTIKALSNTKTFNIIATDEQTVKRLDNKFLVIVSNIKPSSKAVFPYRGSDNTVLDAMKPNDWIQSNADEIKILAQEAVNNAKDAITAARNIERFVDQYIDEKNFSVGYATALEVAKSKQGDCTEHALLTAALCRAVGIPAKIVFGLVYVEQFENEKDLFGGHAWTQVYLDEKWISLDASLGRYNTGHIALGVSDGDPADFFQLTDIIGNLEILSIE